MAPRLHAAHVVAGVVLTVGMGACGNSAATPEEVRAGLVSDLATDLVAETDGALDPVQATCVAEGLVDEVGIDRLEGLAAADVLAEASDDLRDQVIDVFASCDAIGPLVDQTG